MESPISVRSEVGKLKTVLLHRPGVELENLMPDYLSHQLFDDIPYLIYAQQEHDTFACILRQCGVNVVYLKDLLCEAVNRAGVREELVNDYVREAHLYGSYMQEAVKEYLLALPTDKLFDAMAGGVRKSQIPKLTKYHLVDHAQEDFPFYAESMPNLYFTRDPFACLGNGVIISHMANEIRQRETLFADYIFRYHPIYKNVPHW
ncbi:MAG: arginine deiminase, partial [Clostridia bacterium]|nr:arginine deiminase [Clostridia bacterium]